MRQRWIACSITASRPATHEAVGAKPIATVFAFGSGDAATGTSWKRVNGTWKATQLIIGSAESMRRLPAVPEP